MAISPREGVLFGSNLGGTIVTNGDLYGVHLQQRRDAALFKITLGRLVRIVTVLMLAWSAHSIAWQSVPSARAAKCPASTGAVAMNDLQETVWSSSSHLQHNGISSVLHPSSQHMPFFSNPGHDLVVRPVIVKLSSRFGWRQTLWCYK